MTKYTIIYILFILSLISCSGRRPPAELLTPSSPETTSIPGSYTINGERYYPLPDSVGFTETGKASWYGRKFHGRPTANGEIYDMYKISAAHKTLPLGTYVDVLNLDNKKQITLRINDRGPFVKGRIIDLSYAAAREIGLVGPGTCDVRIRALGKESDKENPDLERGEFTIQIGAFKEKTNALKLAERLMVVFDNVEISEFRDESSTTYYRIHVSKTETLSNAGEIEKKLEELGFTGAFIVRL